MARQARAHQGNMKNAVLWLTALGLLAMLVVTGSVAG